MFQAATADLFATLMLGEITEHASCGHIGFNKRIFISFNACIDRFRSINKAGFLVTEVNAILTTLIESRRVACRTLGRGHIKAGQVVELAAPLMHSNRIDVILLLPLINAFRSSPFVSMVGAGAVAIEEYNKFFTQWET